MNHARFVSVSTVVALSICADPAVQARADDAPTLSDLLARVGLYVAGFQRDFATVISDETYTQRERRVVTTGNRSRTITASRTIQSETLFLWVEEDREWLTARNVLKVDRKRVADSRTRLEDLLKDPAPGVLGRVRRLRDESARFNIGGILRNSGDPTLALQVVDRHHQPRFEFRLDNAETVGTILGWKISFAERALPTMIKVDGHDAPATGAVWVTASGIILRTRLDLEDAFSHIKLSLTVTHGRDGKLAGWVPARMDETYVQEMGQVTAPSPVTDAIPARPLVVVPFNKVITCLATYTNYRRFETSARLVVR
jgi:hypothetical protein